jgi:hypothetical protein
MIPQTQQPVLVPAHNAPTLAKKHASPARSLPAVPVFQQLKSEEDTHCNGSSGIIQRKLYIKTDDTLYDNKTDFWTVYKKTQPLLQNQNETNVLKINNHLLYNFIRSSVNYAYSDWETVVDRAIKDIAAEKESNTVRNPSGAPPPPPPPAVASGPVELSPAVIKTYEDCLKEGKKRKEKLASIEQQINEGRSGRLHPDVKKQRDNLFGLYSTKPSQDYAGHLESKLQGDLGGNYTNKIEPGAITAEANAHNNSKANGSLLSNSELLFQQYQSKQKDVPLQTLTRSHVASGTGASVLQYIEHHEFQKEPITNKLIGVNSDYCQALLGTQNGSAALWLIIDHGIELGIKGIEGVTIKDLRERVFEFKFKSL